MEKNYGDLGELEKINYFRPQYLERLHRLVARQKENEELAKKYHWGTINEDDVDFNEDIEEIKEKINSFDSLFKELYKKFDKAPNQNIPIAPKKNNMFEIYGIFKKIDFSLRDFGDLIKKIIDELVYYSFNKERFLELMPYFNLLNNIFKMYYSFFNSSSPLKSNLNVFYDEVSSEDKKNISIINDYLYNTSYNIEETSGILANFIIKIQQ